MSAVLTIVCWGGFAGFVLWALLHETTSEARRRHIVPPAHPHERYRRPTRPEQIGIPRTYTSQRSVTDPTVLELERLYEMPAGKPRAW